MQTKYVLSGLLLAALALSGCNKQAGQNSDGNGPGNADGAGGRADPAAPSSASSSTPGTAESPPRASP